MLHNPKERRDVEDIDRRIDALPRRELGGSLRSVLLKRPGPLLGYSNAVVHFELLLGACSETTRTA
jgi:hypothetical protein